MINSAASRYVHRRTNILPLPKGEDRGEGEQAAGSSSSVIGVWGFRSALIVMLWLAAFNSPAADEVSDPEEQGRALALQLLAQQPTKDYTNTGVLHIRDVTGKTTDVPLRCEIHVTDTNWSMTYDAATGTGERLVIVRTDGQPNQYHFHPQNGKEVSLSGQQIMSPLAGSDFWIADLGQEFLHWPQQKILKKEIKRGQGCTVLESTNPHPTAGGYSRIVSWIDSENGGLIQAFAYDADNQRLKEFYPKEVKKVNGQWQVGMMEMDNDQTDSRTRLEINLDSASNNSQK